MYETLQDILNIKTIIELIQYIFQNRTIIQFVILYFRLIKPFSDYM